MTQKQEVEKLFAKEVKEPISEVGRKIAINAAYMELVRPPKSGEVSRAIRGDLSPAEFLDPMIEVSYSAESIRAWIQKTRKQTIRKWWQLIPKVYGISLVKEEPYAGEKHDRTFGETIEGMIRQAQTNQTKVTSTVYGVPYVIGPEIQTLEEGRQCMEMAWLNYHAELQETMEQDQLQVTGHTIAWCQKQKKDPDSAAYAERLGKRMQAEMKRAGTDLTEIMFCRTATFEDKYNPEGNHVEAAKILIECWEYGPQFGKIIGFPSDQIEKLRAQMPDAQKIMEKKVEKMPDDSRVRK